MIKNAFHRPITTTKYRLTALAARRSDSLPRPASCADLLGGEARLEALWYGRIGATAWPAADWDGFGEAVLCTRIERRFAGTAMAPERLPLVFERGGMQVEPAALLAAAGAGSLSAGDLASYAA